MAESAGSKTGVTAAGVGFKDSTSAGTPSEIWVKAGTDGVVAISDCSPATCADEMVAHRKSAAINENS
jgi:hypothetical protein